MISRKDFIKKAGLSIASLFFTPTLIEQAVGIIKFHDRKGHVVHNEIIQFPSGATVSYRPHGEKEWIDLGTIV